MSSSSPRSHSTSIPLARSGPLKGTSPVLALTTLVITLAAVVAGAGFGDATAEAVGVARAALNPFLEWYYVLLVAFLLLFMIWLGVGRFKNVRLGGDEEEPEFSFWSWVAMLFAAGTGIGILFWSVAQPVLQFADNPFETALSPEAATTAMRLTFFHWGLNGWAIFAFVGLVLGYFAFRHNLPLTLRSALYPLLGDRIRGGLGHVVDTLAVFATVFGIATTLGLGVQQLSTGLGAVFGIAPSPTLQLGIIAVLMVVATLSLVSGLQQGVRLLSVGNFWLSIAVVIALLLLGPTQYILGLTVEATGAYLQNLIVMSFHTNVNVGDGWQAEWTVFFWGWWLAWSPFVGMFIARVSRGRTFREYVMGVLLVPSVMTIIWLGLFGGTALYQELFGAGGILQAVQDDVALAVFVTLEALELGLLGSVLAVAVLVLICTYLVTSANAGTLVVTTVLAGGDPEPPTLHRIVWGVILALLTGVLLVAGGLETLQSAVIMAALPFSIVIIAMMVGLMWSLEQERFAARQGRRREAPHEPWVEVESAGARPHRHRPKAVRRGG